MPTSARFLIPIAALFAAALPPSEAGAWLRHPDRFDAAVVEPLRVAPLALPGEAAPDHVPGLLTTPPGWTPGDAAVVVLGEADATTAVLRPRLMEALLAEGAALLELDTEAVHGLAVDSAVVPPAADGPALLPELFGALIELRRQAGVGTVVAMGLGDAGGAALLAVAEGQAARRLPAGEAGFAAAVALDRDGAGFAPGAPPPAREGWALRAPLLCEAIAAAAGHAAAATRQLVGRCTAALLARPPADAGVAVQRVAQGERQVERQRER